MDKTTLLSEEQAARLLGFSRAWLMKKRLAGEGPRYIKFPFSNRVLYDPKDLEEWVLSLKTQKETKDE